MGENNYVVYINANVPASLFWSIVIYDAETRCLIDNRNEEGEGKATVGSRTKGLRENSDGSYYMFLGPGDPPKGGGQLCTYSSRPRMVVFMTIMP